MVIVTVTYPYKSWGKTSPRPRDRTWGPQYVSGLGSDLRQMCGSLSPWTLPPYRSLGARYCTMCQGQRSHRLAQLYILKSLRTERNLLKSFSTPAYRIHMYMCWCSALQCRSLCINVSESFVFVTDITCKFARTLDLQHYSVSAAALGNRCLLRQYFIRKEPSVTTGIHLCFLMTSYNPSWHLPWSKAGVTVSTPISWKQNGTEYRHAFTCLVYFLRI